MVLGMIAVLTACGGSSSPKEEAPAPVVTVLPTCTIEQGVPTGYSMGVMHVSCTGEQVINSATVTIDGVVKNVDFVAGATSIDYYMSFYNLQPDTTYKAELNVVANGEPLEAVFGNLVTGSYETPESEVDTIKPVITITGGTTAMIVGETYTSPTVTAYDNIDGDITFSIVKSGDTVNPDVAGTYIERYDVMDESGNPAIQGTHTVVVSPVAISTPTISMEDVTVNDEGGSSDISVGTPTVTDTEAGATYSFTSDIDTYFDSTGATEDMLILDSSTGTMTWHGDLYGNGTTDFVVTITITNPDGGNGSDTFILSVRDSG